MLALVLFKVGIHHHVSIMLMMMLVLTQLAVCIQKNGFDERHCQKQVR
jgi:hypothetical protein